MNYKISTLLLAIGLIVSLFTLKRTMDSNKQALTNAKSIFVPLDATAAKTLCAKRPMTSSSGEFIKSADAGKKLKAYKDYMTFVNTGYQAKDDVYGFAFGINRIDELITQIKDYNKTFSPDSITGIRIYMARAAIGATMVQDAFIIPALKNGDNFYNIDPDFEPTNVLWKQPTGAFSSPSILNTSVPCPNRCN